MPHHEYACGCPSGEGNRPFQCKSCCRMDMDAQIEAIQARYERRINDLRIWLEGLERSRRVGEALRPPPRTLQMGPRKTKGVNDADLLVNGGVVIDARIRVMEELNEKLERMEWEILRARGEWDRFWSAR
ncbi:MAG: hypothetical protein Q9217_006507 [Psora testacea]